MIIFNTAINKKIKSLIDECENDHFPVKLGQYRDKYFSENEINIINQISKYEFHKYCYLIKHNMEVPTCKFCNKNAKFISWTHGFKIICESQICMSEQRKLVCIEKYGVDSPAKNEKIKDKIKATCLRKYGVEHYLQTQDVKDKGKKTSYRKYGVDHPMKSLIVQEKHKNVCIEKYGNPYPLSLSRIKNKSKSTWEEKYGVDHHMKKYFLNIDLFTDKYITENFLTKNNNIDFNKMINFYNMSSTTIYRKIKNLGIKYNSHNISFPNVIKENNSLL